TLHLARVLVPDHLSKRGRHHLPGQAELVLEPAAGALRAAAGDELAPVIVHLLLVLAVDLERDGLAELEVRAAVEGHEPLALDLELHGHDRSSRPAVDLEALLAVAADAEDLGVLEDGHVELRGLLGLAVEPQAGGYLVRADGHLVLLWLK